MKIPNSPIPSSHCDQLLTIKVFKFLSSEFKVGRHYSAKRAWTSNSVFLEFYATVNFIKWSISIDRISPTSV